MAKRAKPIDYTLNKIISYLLQHKHTATAPKIEDQQPLELSHSDILDCHSNSHHSKYHSVRKLNVHSNKPSSLNIPVGLSIPSSLKISYDDLSIRFPGTDMGILFVNKLYSKLLGRFHVKVFGDGSEGSHYIETGTYSLDYLEIPNLNGSGFKTASTEGAGNFYNNTIWFKSEGVHTYCSFDLYTHKFNSAVVGNLVAPEDRVEGLLNSFYIDPLTSNNTGFCNIDNINTEAASINSVPRVTNYNKHIVNNVGKIYDVDVAGTWWWNYSASTWIEAANPHGFDELFMIYNPAYSFSVNIKNVVRAENDLIVSVRFNEPLDGWIHPPSTAANLLGLRVYDSSTDSWSNHTGDTYIFSTEMPMCGLMEHKGNCTLASHSFNWSTQNIDITLSNLFGSTKFYILETIAYKTDPYTYSGNFVLTAAPIQKFVCQFVFDSRDY